MNCKTLFAGKIRKYFKLSSADIFSLIGQLAFVIIISVKIC